jgi:hypothetical protein
MPSSSMEDGMTTNEFYYLLLVLGAFGSFAASLSLARLRYVAWLRRTSPPVRLAAETVPVKAAPAPVPLARAA